MNGPALNELTTLRPGQGGRRDWGACGIDAMMAEYSVRIMLLAHPAAVLAVDPVNGDTWPLAGAALTRRLSLAIRISLCVGPRPFCSARLLITGAAGQGIKPLELMATRWNQRPSAGRILPTSARMPTDVPECKGRAGCRGANGSRTAAMTGVTVKA